MSKVTITKKQANFIEGFKKPYHWDNETKVVIGEELPMWAGQALHNLMQFGFDYGLIDADDNEVSDDKVDPEGNFQHDQVPLLIEAVMNGYEVEKEEVVLYMEFHDAGHFGERKLYYGAGTHVTNKFSASSYDLNVECEKEKVEKLKEQGWEVEEVK